MGRGCALEICGAGLYPMGLGCTLWGWAMLYRSMGLGCALWIYGAGLCPMGLGCAL